MGGILRDVANNLVFSYQSVISFLESHDPFELLAAPFISFFGTAANVMTELVTAGGIAFDGSQQVFSPSSAAFKRRARTCGRGTSSAQRLRRRRSHFAY